jgi:hypothetical protein
MVRHVVFMTFNEGVEAEARTDLIEKLYAMADTVEVIRALEVGQNFAEAPSACDLVLMVDVDNEDALDLYNDHPNVVPVSELVMQLCSATYVVDYEIAMG